LQVDLGQPFTSTVKLNIHVKKGFKGAKVKALNKYARIRDKNACLTFTICE